MTRRRGAWHIWSEIVQDEETGEWREVLHPTPEKQQPPKKPPAGGTIEKSADENWLTVYRAPTAAEREQGIDQLLPIKVFIWIGER